MADQVRNTSTSSWAIRRRFMFAVVAFCMATVAYVLWKDLDSSPADTAVNMSFLVIFGIVGSYVFGATWEDVSMARLRAPGARQVKPQTTVTATATMEDAP